METFEDFKNDIKVFTDIVNSTLIRKNRWFMKYVSKIIQFIFEDNKQKIISWLNATDDKMLILSERTVGNHYIEIGIGLTEKFKRIDIIWFEAHDRSGDPKMNYNSAKIDFNSTDESINEFFKHEYNNFLKLYTPLGYVDTICVVAKVINMFNEALYEKFGSMFTSIRLNYEKFKNSKYALSFSDEKLSEICNEILKTYDEFVKNEQELNWTIETSEKICISH